MESEEPVHEHLAELFARIEPDCVLDVGANTGQYGAMLRDHGYGGWIVSFEPVAAAFAELARRAGQDPRWRALPLALGAGRERREIAVAEATQLSSFRRFTEHGRRELPGASAVAGAEQVEVRTLKECWDAELGDLEKHRPFLKLDTQGWELEVLRGAGDVLERLAGLQVETPVTPIYQDVPAFGQAVEHVIDLGFGLTGVFPVNRDSLLRLIELDCVFINPAHPDAHTWQRDTWAILTERFRREAAALIPPGATFILIDDATLGLDRLDGREAVPFLERDGEYAGAPEDGEHALVELDRVLAERQTHHLAIAWPSFWWLEEYPQLKARLRDRWREAHRSDAAIVYELGDDFGLGQ
jgi:FkbM family methyltransferase